MISNSKTCFSHAIVFICSYICTIQVPYSPYLSKIFIQRDFFLLILRAQWRVHMGQSPLYHRPYVRSKVTQQLILTSCCTYTVPSLDILFVPLNWKRHWNIAFLCCYVWALCVRTQDILSPSVGIFFFTKTTQNFLSLCSRLFHHSEMEHPCFLIRDGGHTNVREICSKNETMFRRKNITCVRGLVSPLDKSRTHKRKSSVKINLFK